jgi:hypothetical protein
MAELAAISTVASVVSAAHAAVELTKHSKTLVESFSNARTNLDIAVAFREESLVLMEKHKDNLPHKIVHEWRVKHSK